MSFGFDPQMLIQAMAYRMQNDQAARELALREELGRAEIGQRDRALGLDEQQFGLDTQRFGESVRQFDVNTGLSEREMAQRGALGNRELDLRGRGLDLQAQSNATESSRVQAAIRAQQLEQALRMAFLGGPTPQGLPPESASIIGAVDPANRAAMSLGYAPSRSPQMSPLEALAYGPIQEQFGNQSLTPEARDEMLRQLGATSQALSPRQPSFMDLWMQQQMIQQGLGGGGLPPMAPPGGAAPQPPAGGGELYQPGPGPLPGMPPQGAMPSSGAGDQLAQVRQAVMADLQAAAAQGLDKFQAIGGLQQKYGPQVTQQLAQDPEVVGLAQQLFGGQPQPGAPAAPAGGAAPPQGAPAAMETPAAGGGMRPTEGRSFTMPGDAPPETSVPPLGAVGPGTPGSNAARPTAPLGAVDPVAQNPLLAGMIQNALRQRLQGAIANAVGRGRRRPMAAVA